MENKTYSYFVHFGLLDTEGQQVCRGNGIVQLDHKIKNNLDLKELENMIQHQDLKASFYTVDVDNIALLNEE